MDLLELIVWLVRFSVVRRTVLAETFVKTFLLRSSRWACTNVLRGLIEQCEASIDVLHSLGMNFLLRPCNLQMSLLH